jgi:hypothetical protein
MIRLAHQDLRDAARVRLDHVRLCVAEDRAAPPLSRAFA